MPTHFTNILPFSGKEFTDQDGAVEGRRLAVKRGSREADCRVQLVRQTVRTVVREDGGRDVPSLL